MKRDPGAGAAAQSYFFEGNRSLEAGNLARAEACFRAALRAHARFAEAHANLGYVLEQTRRVDEAEACYRRSLELSPRNALVRQNLGALLARRKRLDEAEDQYRQAIALDGAAPVAWSNLGALLACMKREPEAERCFRKAMALDPSYKGAPFNLGYLLLRQGRFDEGWACLDANKGKDELAASLRCARWSGEPLAGKTVLVLHEAGHGDMIQFCRLTRLLKERGAKSVAMLCHPGLRALFATLDSVDKLIGLDERFAADGWDYWTPLLSIARHCGVRADAIPAQIPYLRADPERAARWAPLLPVRAAGQLRVGLVWKGNPNFENDAERSIASLHVLAPLWSVAQARFVSLQKGAGQDEALHPPAGQAIAALGPLMNDFADAAAIMVGLDLVICVDTAAAHLAGALGRPCWVMLPDYKTDWRWMAERSDSPWYPGTMRIFRQDASGRWPPVVAAVAAALQKLAQSPTRVR